MHTNSLHPKRRMFESFFMIGFFIGLILVRVLFNAVENPTFLRVGASNPDLLRVALDPNDSLPVKHKFLGESELTMASPLITSPAIITPQKDLIILVGVFCDANTYSQDRAIRDAYRAGLDNSCIRLKFFFGNIDRLGVKDENETHQDIIVGSFTENMNEGKTFEWFLSASSLEPFDYAIKMDQDTVVNWSKLVKAINIFGNSPLYFGNRVFSWAVDPLNQPIPALPAPSTDCTNFKQETCWFYMSGGFYGLSADVVHSILKCPYAVQNTHGYEDALTGSWVFKCFPDVNILEIPSGLIHTHYYYNKENLVTRILHPNLQVVPLPNIQPYIVAANLIGRLGNQLFIAASSFGIAFSRNSQWCLPNLEGSILQSAVVFHIQPITCNPEGMNTLNEYNGFLHYHNSIMHGSSNVLLQYYLQSYR